MRRPPTLLLPLFVGSFRAALDALQDGIRIQAVLLGIFDIPGLDELKDHEPVGVGTGRNQYAQFLAAGNVMGYSQSRLSTLLSRKLITLGNVDVGDIAKVPYRGAALPVDFRTLLLWLLSPCGQGKNYQKRKEKEKKERSAPVACHTFILLRLFWHCGA